ncbi:MULTISPECIES: serine/threonine-protein kinase [Streptacidiphilus]|uniref:non-specific serine/threonine protein kinase n=1 Tax=Streptacidiphilus cavernicola TaxID=3342716 RepID=A0ABV6UGM2_9ACTN|nr:serine/threonine-protein kinase [Streptacidiphilus jeojiense]
MTNERASAQQAEARQAGAEKSGAEKSGAKAATPAEGGGAAAGRLLAGRYRLASVLGQGGMGTVWRAKDEMLGRDVAVKQLRLTGVDEDERHRLIARALTEAKAIARIRHTAAVTVYDVVEEDDRPWIVMELVESRALSQVIREDGVLTPRRAAEIGLDLLGVLTEAHRSGILHRDVKPSNVLIGHDGRVVLTDFGIARVEGDPSVTSTGMLVGAPSYISPERARGRIPGAPSDLWSLGATLYAMVEGHPPYDKGSALSTLTAVMTEELAPPKGGGALVPVIEGLLRKDPDDRLNEAEARRMLQAVLDQPDEPVPAPVTGAQPEQTRIQPVPPLPPSGVRHSVPYGPATPYGTPTVSTAGRRRVRPLLVLLVLLLVVAIGVVAAVAAARNGNHRNASRGASVQGSTVASVSASASVSGAASTGAGTGTGSGSAAAGSAASSAASGTAAAGAFHRVQGPGGSTVEIPVGWTLVSSSGTSWKYHGPAGTLQLDATSTPGSSAVGAWRTEEAAISGGFPDYRRVALRTVGYRDGWDAADWEWTYSHAGTTLHSLNRGFVTDAHHGYAIYWTAPDATWKDARNQQLLNRFFSSFQPAG